MYRKSRKGLIWVRGEGERSILISGPRFFLDVENITRNVEKKKNTFIVNNITGTILADLHAT